jgi:pyridinium-3,5-biscarboxylic acid mononucleotide synthase
VKLEHIRDLLERLASGRASTDEVLGQIQKLPFEDLGFAKIDHHRRIRNGYPEVIYGEGKTPNQVAEIFARLADHNPNVLCTRASPAAAEAVRKRVPEARHHELCRLIELRRDQAEPTGCVAVAAAGTSDLSVAEEAAISLEVFGSRVHRLYDVGVAGIHRLFAHLDALRKAQCVVAVAGMEGALPSVVAGLVDVPVIAVPTSVGYGVAFGGITALFAMLNSCASGISVVNVDNGFGAAYQADMINKLAARARQEASR